MKGNEINLKFQETKKIIERGEFNKLPELSEEFFSQKDPNDRNLVCLAICYGQLDKLPKHLLTKNLLLEKDSDGNTALHHACYQYGLEYIPKEFLKREYLKVGNNMDESVYHIAADYGQLDQIPPSEFDEQILLMADKTDHKVLNRVLCPEIRRDIPDFDQSAIVLKYLNTETIKKHLKKTRARGPRNNDDNLDYEGLRAELHKRIRTKVKEKTNEHIEI